MAANPSISVIGSFITAGAFVLCLAAGALSCHGTYSRRAIRGIDFSDANLSEIDCYNLNIEGMRLARAKCIRTSFMFARMKNVILYNADLREADFSGADLRGADLRGANCRKTIFRNAIMQRTNLIDAYLYGADLRGADLRGASLIEGGCAAVGNTALLRYAHMRDADCEGAVISSTCRDFIQAQNVKNFQKIIWSK